MTKFLIIGLGTIGYRHFESLYNSKKNYHIHCFDISKKSIQRVENLIKSKKNDHVVKIIKRIDKIDDQYDFLLHATSSDVRLKIIKRILRYSRFKYAILEKILTQSVTQLKEYKLISKNFKMCWVNTPMHEIDLYKKLKKKININNVSKIEFNNFDGLACNSIHFIDFISTWKKNLPVKIDTSNLRNWYRSKRKGFFDVFGELRIVYKDKTVLVLKSYKKNRNYHCKIHDNKTVWTLNESKNSFYSSNGYLRKGKVEYQSQLTNLIVEKIMKYKHCDLPNLNWSIQCHTPLLESLLKYWNSV